jgi:hypothetical protein
MAKDGEMQFDPDDRPRLMRKRFALRFVRPRHYRDGMKFRLQVRRAFIRVTLWHQVYALTWYEPCHPEPRGTAITSGAE